MTQVSLLFEELLTSKQGLGAEYTFEKNSLEIKPNEYGVSGLFARRALAKGSEVVSVPQLNGSLTPIRAYEEAQDLLKKLGPERFNLKDMFIVTCAMYLRFTNTETKYNDLLVTVPDLKAFYADTPMSASDSLDKSKLLNSNNKIALDAAAKIQEQMLKMQVDPKLFRATLAYVYSRSWGENHGIIPVLDWLNSAYGDSANCECRFSNGFYSIVLLKDVKANEELMWNYNSADANLTWFSYGYVDLQRPTKNFLILRLEQNAKNRFENFAIHKLNWSKARITPSYKINQNEFEFALLVPGVKILSKALLLESIGQCIKYFKVARVWFRAFILSQEEGDIEAITPDKLDSDIPFFGLEVEKKVIASMRLSLQQGLREAHEKIAEFSQSEIGCKINMSPYIEMVELSTSVWDEILVALEGITSAANINDIIPIINNKLGLDIHESDSLKTTLVEAVSQNPTLIGFVLQRYVLGRL